MTDPAQSIVIHAMTDDELQHMAIHVQARASADQRLASQMRREIKRRKRARRQAIIDANKGD
jgi:hypothetical protein